MRPIVIAIVLLAAYTARAGSVPFPEIDSGPLCEEFAQKAPKGLQGILGGVGSVVDPEKVKDSARGLPQNARGEQEAGSFDVGKSARCAPQDVPDEGHQLR
jgi:hypothetical protein